MPNFAKQIAGHGRFGDTLVAHLTKAQANTLKKRVVLARSIQLQAY